MTKQFLDEVKDQLASRSMRTTLEALQQRGLQKVRVIRSSQVLQLIEEAVDRAIVQRGLTANPHERSQVLAASQEIFQGMMSEDGSSDRALLDEYRNRQEELENQLKLMRSQLREQGERMGEQEELLNQRSLQMQEAQTKAAEYNAELQVLHQRQQSAAPDALLGELRALRSEIGQQRPVQPVQPLGSEALEQKLASLGQQLGKEIEKIGRKVGVSGAEEVDADFSTLFASDQTVDLESNLDTVEAREHKGADVADALARMRSLRRGNK